MDTTYQLHDTFEPYTTEFLVKPGVYSVGTYGKGKTYRNFNIDRFINNENPINGEYALCSLAPYDRKKPNYYVLGKIIDSSHIEVTNTNVYRFIRNVVDGRFIMVVPYNSDKKELWDLKENYLIYSLDYACTKDDEFYIVQNDWLICHVWDRGIYADTYTDRGVYWITYNINTKERYTRFFGDEEKCYELRVSSTYIMIGKEPLRLINPYTLQDMYIDALGEYELLSNLTEKQYNEGNTEYWYVEHNGLYTHIAILPKGDKIRVIQCYVGLTEFNLAYKEFNSYALACKFPEYVYAKGLLDDCITLEGFIVDYEQVALFKLHNK